MLGLRRLPSPIKAFTFRVHIPSPPFSRNSLFDLVCGRSELLRFCRTHVCSKSETHLLTFGRVLQKKVMHSLNLSGKLLEGQKLFVGSFLGFSVATGLIYQQTNDIYAMDDDYADMEDPSRFLKDDLHTFWSLARKYQLPLVLLATVLLGWRHPFVLAINVAVLLFCTRPNPFSIYMFVEQLGQRDMRRNPSLQTKALYVKKVEVEDYKILCIARVELRDMKMEVIGILGGWWVFQTSPAHRP